VSEGFWAFARAEERSALSKSFPGEAAVARKSPDRTTSVFGLDNDGLVRVKQNVFTCATPDGMYKQTRTCLHSIEFLPTTFPLPLLRRTLLWTRNHRNFCALEFPHVRRPLETYTHTQLYSISNYIPFLPRGREYTHNYLPTTTTAIRSFVTLDNNARLSVFAPRARVLRVYFIQYSTEFEFLLVCISENVNIRQGFYIETVVCAYGPEV